MVAKKLHSDQGRNYKSVFLVETCQLLGIEKTRMTALDPFSDGKVERYNHTFLHQLAIYVEEHKKTWNQDLRLLLMSYETALLLKVPLDLLYSHLEDNHPAASYTGYAEGLKHPINAIHYFMQERLKLASDRMKRHHEINADKIGFRQSMVWLYKLLHERTVREQTLKLSRCLEGPYLVRKRINDVVYRIHKDR
ncbi:uncharacterized protein LOC106461865 [Limulus polyphemus]|uniref:Uncharacterized protein LOC106461865 n=1 Tax=Limulus polyphemus TaxID=6850 RepID=A0ABM1B8W2_LIMPO|nr:uncharacterized protein LOC106461865 [Limulus polyphemus]